MLVDKIIIERHPSKIDKDGKRHYTLRAIPYQDPEMEAERLKAVHQARVKIVPQIVNDQSTDSHEEILGTRSVVSEGAPAVQDALGSVPLHPARRWPLQSLLCTCCTCGLDALSCLNRVPAPTDHGAYVNFCSRIRRVRCPYFIDFGKFWVVSRRCSVHRITLSLGIHEDDRAQTGLRTLRVSEFGSI